MTPEDPPFDEMGTRLLAVLQGLDLTSADGRAGIGTLLSEIERLAPGAILSRAAPSMSRPDPAPNLRVP